MSKKSIFKGIRFPVILVELGERKSETLGMNFSEWVRYLVVKELQGSFEDIEIHESKKLLEDEDNLEYYLGQKYLKELEKSTDKVAN